MTFERKQQMYIWGVVAICVVLVLRYWLSFEADPLTTIAYAINPISIVSYLTEIVSLTLIAGIIWILTLRNLAKSRYSQQWKNAHYDNEEMRAEKEVKIVRQVAMLSVDNDDFIKLLNEGRIDIAKTSMANALVGDAVRIRHQDDYGQIIDGVVEGLDQHDDGLVHIRRSS